MGSNIAGFPARFLGRHVWKPVHRCPFATSPGKVSHRPLDRLFRGSKANRATRACRWQNVFKIWMSQHNLAGQQGNLFKSQMQNRSNDAVYQQTVKRFSRRPAGIRPPSGRTFFFVACWFDLFCFGRPQGPPVQEPSRRQAGKKALIR